MYGPAVFSTVASCFGPVDEAAYAELTAPGPWTSFVEAVAAADSSRAVDDVLSEGESEALRNPPSCESHRSFCRRHFTGGLAVSAMPVESLYRTRRASLDAEPGSYGSDSACYMSSLVEGLGLVLPPALAAYPDHLAVELEVLAVLQRAGCVREAASFLRERFDWLAAYRRRLLRLDDPLADFYLALVDIVIDATAVCGLHGDGFPVADGVR